MNEYNTHYLIQKWKGTHNLPVEKQTWIKNWPAELKENPPKIKKNIVFMKYPYFEKDIYKLQKRGYWIPSHFGEGHWNAWESKTKASNKDTY